MDKDVRLRRSSFKEKLAELETIRRRREQLLAGYQVIESSKFARVATAWKAIRAIVSDVPAFRPSIVSEARSRSNVDYAVVDESAALEQMRLELRRIDTDRAMLHDLVEYERNRADEVDPYRRWKRNHALREDDIARLQLIAPLLPSRPKISILMATYASNETYLREAIESVMAQVYDNWELCIADDASPDSHVREVLSEYAAAEPRIKLVFRDENGHIALATNSAMAIATGEYVALLDHDDVLTRDALFENVALINRHPDADMIYSDEDKIDARGESSEPHFKPDWCPDSFLSRMYTSHLGVYRHAIAFEIGGFRAGFEGSQDYDFVLRFTERTQAIYHIPRVLYHWRMHANSTAGLADAKPYAVDAAKRALEEALARRGEPGRIESDPEVPGIHIVRYAMRERERVTIVMPTRDHGEDVDRALRSIFEKATYPDLEVVLVDNGSVDPQSLATFARWKKYEPRFSVLPHDVPFNFSEINNYAVGQTKGRYLLFLNNDTEVIAPDWIEAMVEQAQRPSIGVVGALLLYPDDTIQHAGVVIGLGGVAGHGHKLYPRDHGGYQGAIRSVNNFSALTAACIMVRRDVFDAVGGFDESLAVAFNDVDFCLKVGKAGYRNVYLPHVKLYHFESKSRGYDTTPEKEARFQSEIATIKARWATHRIPDPCYSINLTLDAENYAIRS